MKAPAPLPPAPCPPEHDTKCCCFEAIQALAHAGCVNSCGCCCCEAAGDTAGCACCTEAISNIIAAIEGHLACLKECCAKPKGK